MTLTAAQVRQARALLGWTSPRLSRTAKVGFDKVLKAQNDEAIATLSFICVGHPHDAGAGRRALRTRRRGSAKRRAGKCAVTPFPEWTILRCWLAART